ncbi:glycoside hydrolase [Pseudoflavonifractor sp. 60]|uniref:glycoside hydrolase family 25 protein n=1 Tax=Pseudoflavonifractor sp. 60 TaxID=2304576 RepID=UPI001369C954|nr:glycoside hydrolase family 25 protein [Pseudoflavonifractor sp. 60]NBI66031.1 glycoside hydrolase [Pseudoflavonifractor sp. 60]
MNEYPEERKPQEETPPPVEPRPRRHQEALPHRPRQSARRGGNGLSILSLVISAAALIVACAALFFTLRTEPEEPPAPPEEPVTFQFGDRVMTPLDGMPLNPYDRNAFSLDEKGRVTYEKDGKRAKTGIDVSAYQQEIDWAAVAADGIDFAILRVGYRGYTEGGLFLDQTFEQNLRGATSAGLDVGVYFFSQAITPQEARQEADYVLSAIEGYEITWPLAFDWEPISAGSNARTDGLDNDTLTQCAAAFCERVRDAGLQPAVYFNQSLGYLRYDLRELTEYNLWLAEYDTKPDFYYHFDLWQYTHTGQVDGIEGNVDLDLDLR